MANQKPVKRSSMSEKGKSRKLGENDARKASEPESTVGDENCKGSDCAVGAAEDIKPESCHDHDSGVSSEGNKSRLAGENFCDKAGAPRSRPTQQDGKRDDERSSKGRRDEGPDGNESSDIEELTLPEKMERVFRASTVDSKSVVPTVTLSATTRGTNKKGGASVRGPPLWGRLSRHLRFGGLLEHPRGVLETRGLTFRWKSGGGVESRAISADDEDDEDDESLHGDDLDDDWGPGHGNEGMVVNEIHGNYPDVDLLGGAGEEPCCSPLLPPQGQRFCFRLVLDGDVPIDSAAAAELLVHRICATKLIPSSLIVFNGRCELHVLFVPPRGDEVQIGRTAKEVCVLSPLFLGTFRLCVWRWLKARAFQRHDKATERREFSFMACDDGSAVPFTASGASPFRHQQPMTSSVPPALSLGRRVGRRFGTSGAARQRAFRGHSKRLTTSHSVSDDLPTVDAEFCEDRRGRREEDEFASIASSPGSRRDSGRSDDDEIEFGSEGGLEKKSREGWIIQRSRKGEGKEGSESLAEAKEDGREEEEEDDDDGEEVWQKELSFASWHVQIPVGGNAAAIPPRLTSDMARKH